MAKQPPQYMAGCAPDRGEAERSEARSAMAGEVAEALVCRL